MIKGEQKKQYISVVLCTYNRDKYVYNMLKSIAENEFQVERYEIVLINNNSTDNTEKECMRFSSDYPNITFRYFVETKQGLSHARNRGIAESLGDIIIYVDDDATVNKAYLKTYSDYFATHPDVKGAGGPVEPVYETEEPKWFSHYIRQLITGELNLGKEPKYFPRGVYPIGCNSVFRKEVFDKVGLFNVDLGRKGTSLIGAEEKDLFDKMTAQGIKFFYLPGAILYHIIPASKLTEEHFDKLTYSIGKSEKIRTLAISKKKYYSRIFSEAVKWVGTIVLWCKFFVTANVRKGNKLILFRYNVTRGLLEK
ncbi:MAG: glycosyltransferase [Bacteroidales bacterium]|nr:glycosyltransferase [Bacteroidales bacterium]